jgi:oxaloacetate decarboxylase alpha subunit
LAEQAGVIERILVKEGDAVDLGAPLLSFAGEKRSAVPAAATPTASAPVGAANGVVAPLAGNIWKLEVAAGQQVQEGDLLLILEAMKMENEIIAERDGTISQLHIQEGDAVQLGQVLLTLD